MTTKIVTMDERFKSDCLEIANELSKIGITSETIVEDGKPKASTIEISIPTAIAIFVAYPFFHSFITEAGKSAWNFVKEKIKEIFKNNKDIKFWTALGGIVKEGHLFSMVVLFQDRRLIFVFSRELPKFDREMDAIYRCLTSGQHDFEDQMYNFKSKIKSPKESFILFFNHKNNKWLIKDSTTRH